MGLRLGEQRVVRPRQKEERAGQALLQVRAVQKQIRQDIVLGKQAQKEVHPRPQEMALKAAARRQAAHHQLAHQTRATQTRRIHRRQMQPLERRTIQRLAHQLRRPMHSSHLRHPRYRSKHAHWETHGVAMAVFS